MKSREANFKGCEGRQPATSGDCVFCGVWGGFLGKQKKAPGIVANTIMERKDVVDATAPNPGIGIIIGQVSLPGSFKKFQKIWYCGNW